jgi:hypothetical protein
VRDLERFLPEAKRVEHALGDVAAAEIEELVVNLQVARDNAQRSGTDQFKLEALQQVGSEAWVRFGRQEFSRLRVGARRSLSYAGGPLFILPAVAVG